MSAAPSERRVRAAMLACVGVLLACVVTSLVRDFSDAAGSQGPVRAAGVGPTCVPLSRTGGYTGGRTLLLNGSAEPVVVTGVRLEGARGVRLDQAYAVPATAGVTIGDASRWPPSSEQLRQAPGWLSRVRAVGEDRLTPLDGGGWNLVLHLEAAGRTTPSYDAVVVDYRVGDTEHVVRSGSGLDVSRGSCPRAPTASAGRTSPSGGR